MKPSPFIYHNPRDLDAALDLIATRENAKLLAGGQSLMPMLNMRFVIAEDVIDLNQVPGLDGIEESNTHILIGAMTRQRDIEASEILARRCPLLIEAVQLIGHRQTRNWGTIGGSLCHLDPAAELPVAAQALNATIHIQSQRGKRTLKMSEFPAFYMTPAIEQDEIVTAVEFEPWQSGHGWGFTEFARRVGDFAVVSAAALLELDGLGVISRASVVIGGVGSGPVQCVEAEDVLLGSNGNAMFERASQACAEVETSDDVHASSDYRRHLARVMSRRSLNLAFDRATKAASV